jgi:hypothetical protein
MVTSSPGSVNVTTTVDLDVTDPSSVGTWQFRVTDGRAAVQPWFKSGVVLALADPNQSLRSDSETEVPVRLVRSDGTAVDPAIYSLEGPTAEAAAGGPVTVTSLGEEGWVLTVPPVDTAALPTSRLLSVTLGLTSKPNGVQLETLEQIFDLTATLAPSYPPVLSKELTFPKADTTGPATASLAVKGSSTGPSAVCVGAMSFKGPTGPLPLAPVAGTLDAANCLNLEQDEQRDIEFSTEVTELADGQATGAVSLELRGSQPSDPVVTMQVPAVMSLERPTNPLPATLWVFVLMLVAAAVPIVIVGLLGRRVLAKFTSGDLRYISVPVVVRSNSDGDWSVSTAGVGGLAVDPATVKWQSVPEDARQVTLNGAPLEFDANFEFIRTRSLGPIRRFPVLSVRASATAKLTAAGDLVMASNRNPFTHNGRKAPASLRLDECWFLIASRARVVAAQEGGTLEAQLVAIGKGHKFPDPDVSERAVPVLVTRMVEEMRRHIGSHPSETPESPVTVTPAQDHGKRPPESKLPW